MRDSGFTFVTILIGREISILPLESTERKYWRKEANSIQNVG
jgi:hypothetical protein